MAKIMMPQQTRTQTRSADEPKHEQPLSSNRDALSAMQRQPQAQTPMQSPAPAALRPMPSATGLTSGPMQAKKTYAEDHVKFAGQDMPEITNSDQFVQRMVTNKDDYHHMPWARGNIKQLVQEALNQPQYQGAMDSDLGNAGRTVDVRGLAMNRVSTLFLHGMGHDQSDESIVSMFQNLGSVSRYNRLQHMGQRTQEQQAQLDAYTPEDVTNMNQSFDAGMMQLKPMYLERLRNLRNTYGTYITQMHPEDFIAKVGPKFEADRGILQDTHQLVQHAGQYFDFENNPEDREFKQLSDYYNDACMNIDTYMSFTAKNGMESQPLNADTANFLENTPERMHSTEAEQSIGGPGLSKKDNVGYLKRLKKRFKRTNRTGQLFGRYK